VGCFPNDDERFQQVFDLRHGAIQRFCYRRLDPDCANDAVAEVFLVAWRRLDAVPEAVEALPWLYGVARNVVRHFLRGRQR
jgi:RNA polymerase sigma-70 factor (ECF subfamily)